MNYSQSTPPSSLVTLHSEEIKSQLRHMPVEQFLAKHLESSIQNMCYMDVFKERYIEIKNHIRDRDAQTEMEFDDEPSPSTTRTEEESTQ